jgi:hypothetical protein
MVKSAFFATTEDGNLAKINVKFLLNPDSTIIFENFVDME